jgi:hypothetical protein
LFGNFYIDFKYLSDLWNLIEVMVFGLKEMAGWRLTEAAQSARQTEAKGENKATTANKPLKHKSAPGTQAPPGTPCTLVGVLYLFFL